MLKQANLLTVFVAAIVLATSAHAQKTRKPPVPVTITSACTCKKCHQEWRKAVKSEIDEPPASIAEDHKVTPADIAKWKGPGGEFHKDTPRAGRETEWFQLTGKLEHIKLEADGDIHMQLIGKDAGSNAVQVIVEVPLGKAWCAVRRQAFALTTADFPLNDFTSGKDLTLKKGNPIVTVTGRAFYDAEHASGDYSSNRRNVVGDAPGTVWELHPVMRIKVAKP